MVIFNCCMSETEKWPCHALLLALSPDCQHACLSEFVGSQGKPLKATLQVRECTTSPARIYWACCASQNIVRKGGLHHTANPPHLSQNEITGQLECLGLLAFSCMMLSTFGLCCHMPISARLGIAIPTKGYIANCGFGCMFPVPLWECDDLMLACVITLHYAERSWESKIFSQGLSCSGRAKPRHPQGKNWGHVHKACKLFSRFCRKCWLGFHFHNQSTNTEGT